MFDAIIKSSANMEIQSIHKVKAPSDEMRQRSALSLLKGVDRKKDANRHIFVREIHVIMVVQNVNATSKSMFKTSNHQDTLVPDFECMRKRLTGDTVVKIALLCTVMD